MLHRGRARGFPAAAGLIVAVFVVLLSAPTVLIVAVRMVFPAAAGLIVAVRVVFPIALVMHVSLMAAPAVGMFSLHVVPPIVHSGPSKV